MLNYIWLGLIGAGGPDGRFPGQHRRRRPGGHRQARIYAVYPLGTTLLAVMTLWLGLMRLADKAGLVHRLGLALKPDHASGFFRKCRRIIPAMGAIMLNVAANILGLNNAATPLGLRAMSELEKLNPRPGVATNAMCMLLAINTSSITLIPVTVIGLLAAATGQESDRHHRHLAGRDRHRAALRHRRLQAAGADALVARPTRGERRCSRETVTAANRKPCEGGDVEEDAEADATAAVGAGREMDSGRLRGNVFFAMVVAFAFPELVGRVPSPDAGRACVAAAAGRARSRSWSCRG